MDIFKLLRSKYFYVCMIVFTLLIGVDVYEVKLVEMEMLSTKDLSAAIDEETVNEGFYALGLGFDAGGLVYGHALNLKNLINATYAGNWMIFMAFIIISILVCNDFSSGYIKNTITLPKYRWYANISKLVAAAVVMLIQNLIIFFGYLLLIKFYCKTAVIGDIHFLFRYLFVEFMLYLALSSMIILLCNMIKSKAVSITIGIFISCQILGSFIGAILQSLFHIESEKVYKMIISMKQSNLRVNMSSDEFVYSLLLGLMGMVFYMTLANIVICKKDY